MRGWIPIISLLLAGCTSTVTQKAVSSQAASFDGNVQNSGIISEAGPGYIVTGHFRDRYNALVGLYGKSKLADGTPVFVPALQKDDGLTARGDGTWLMDKEHMADMVLLSDLKRMGAKP